MLHKGPPHLLKQQPKHSSWILIRSECYFFYMQTEKVRLEVYMPISYIVETSKSYIMFELTSKGTNATIWLKEKYRMHIYISI